LLVVQGEINAIET